MLSSIGRRASAVNVIAVLAFVLSMSGGALAAKRYLITSTRQIKPSVLAQLKGAKGVNGAPGAQGPQGPAGPVGARDDNRDNGSDGSSGLTGARAARC